MVIGNGDIGSILKDREGFIFFASGVSNSQCNDPKEFEREFNLLLKQNPTKRLVYFSSLSIYDKDTPYTQHKKRMEGAVKTRFKKYCIIRLGNITWGSNPHTIINFFKEKIRHNEFVEIRDEYKYICDEQEFEYWINKIPNFNTEINIPGYRIHAQQLYDNQRAVR